MLLIGVGLHRSNAQNQPVAQPESQQVVVAPAPVPEVIPPPPVVETNVPAPQPPPPKKKVVAKVVTVKIHGYEKEPTGLQTIHGNPVMVPYSLVKVKGGTEKRLVYKRWGAWQIARVGNNEDRIRAISDAKVAQEKKEGSATAPKKVTSHK